MSSYKSNIQKLDSPWRRAALPPKETLISLGLTADMDFADIGCGIGYFTIPAAAIIGPGHAVYGVDPSEEMLAEAKRRAEAAGIGHIGFVLSDPLDFKIPEASVDFVLLANVFHEIDEKEPFVRCIKEALRPGGKLALIEWNQEVLELGPPLSHRIAVEETDRWMEQGGFEGIDEFYFGEMFYGRVYVKNVEKP